MHWWNTRRNCSWVLPGSKGNGFVWIEWFRHDVGATRKVVMREVLMRKVLLKNIVVLTAVLSLGWVRLGSSTVLGFFNSKAFLLAL